MATHSEQRETIISVLGQCPLFSGIAREELLRLLNKGAGRLRTYHKGDLVVQAGEEVHFLNILISGSVKGEMVDFAGKVIKIEDIQPPRALATAFLFGAQNRYPVNITANEAARLWSVPRADVLRMMQESQTVLGNFLDTVSNRSQFLTSKIRFLSFTTIKGKLAHYLLELSRKQAGPHIRLAHSQSQLAELFGVTRPSVGRALSELNQVGLIRTEGKQVSLLDKAGLSAYLE
jgi:CRP-like cAMP-binding protein